MIVTINGWFGYKIHRKTPNNLDSLWFSLNILRFLSIFTQISFLIPLWFPSHPQVFYHRRPPLCAWMGFPSICVLGALYAQGMEETNCVDAYVIGIAGAKYVCVCDSLLFQWVSWVFSGEVCELYIFVVEEKMAFCVYVYGYCVNGNSEGSFPFIVTMCVHLRKENVILGWGTRR